MNLSLQPARLARAAVLFAVVAGCADEPLTLLPQAPAIDSPEAVVAALVRAYQLRDPDLLASLLANDTDHNAEYVFLLSEPSDTGETQWGYAEEVRLHHRMFHPEKPPDTPVRADIWLQSLSISLAPKGPFAERPDLYSQDAGADGKLDPALWRATDAAYTADLFFDLSGDTDFTIDGTANFVVIENLQKHVGDTGKFLLFIWEDVGPIQAVLGTAAPAGVESSTWGSLKSLYR